MMKLQAWYERNHKEGRVAIAQLFMWLSCAGALYGLTVLALQSITGHPAAWSAFIAEPARSAFTLLVLALYIASAAFIGQRRAVGGLIGLVLFGSMLLEQAWRGQVVSLSSAWAVLGIVLILRCWPCARPAIHPFGKLENRRRWRYMAPDWIRMISHTTRSIRDGGVVPQLPLLRHETSLDSASWLGDVPTARGASVDSFLPGHFAAYARIYHPFVYGGSPSVAPGTWPELATRYGRELRDSGDGFAFAYDGVPDSQASVGRLDPLLIDALLDHLGPATKTPDTCWFAVWEGFGGSAVPHDLGPKLELPWRKYHVFSGPLAGARTSYAYGTISHQSANLWWPADHAWCVATEIDNAWTFVGGTDACVDALLADARLDAVATDATNPW